MPIDSDSSFRYLENNDSNDESVSSASSSSSRKRGRSKDYTFDKEFELASVAVKHDT